MVTSTKNWKSRPTLAQGTYLQTKVNDSDGTGHEKQRSNNHGAWFWRGKVWDPGSGSSESWFAVSQKIANIQQGASVETRRERIQRSKMRRKWASLVVYVYGSSKCLPPLSHSQPLSPSFSFLLRSYSSTPFKPCE
jgi:hypothetical protein